MASLVVTNTFVAATTILSASMNTNFDDIENYINNRNAGTATWDNVNATTAVITTLTVTNLSFIPSGTKMPFYQASVPTGWTAVAVNDKFMRVVTGGGTGGTTGGSGLAPSSTITLAHTHTVASHTHTGPSHTHSTPNHTHVLAATGGGTQAIDSSARYVGGSGSEGGNLLSGTAGAAATIYPVTGTTASGGSGTTGSDGTGNTGSASPATDSQLSNTAFQYADFCVGTKD